jgi:hypothetical protein
MSRRIEAGGVRLSKSPSATTRTSRCCTMSASTFRRALLRHRRPHRQPARVRCSALLLRFYVPQAGRIEIDGVPLATIGDEQFRADVGLVPQEPFLLAASARENIDMGRGLADAQIEAAARAARAHGSSPRSSTATTRRSARAARGCRPARSS